MITLLTGAPGHGKTLYALTLVREMVGDAIKMGLERKVFYANIRELALPWELMADPEKWFELPKGSIIVIDEAQGIFRQRAFGSKVPDYVAQLETHRHHGFDLVLITQHPMLIDTHVRRLVGRHLHTVRAFGFKKSIIHEFLSCREQCDKPAGRKDSLRREFRYRKEDFALYKSAEIHTVKAKLPREFWWLVGAAGALAVCGWLLYAWWSGSMFKPAEIAEASKPRQAVAGKVGGSIGGAGAAPIAAKKTHGERVYEFVEERRPVIDGLAYTAPVYAGLIAPKSVPAPVGCVAVKARCWCYTDQGTRLGDVPDKLCRQIVDQGFYVDYQAPRGAQLMPQPAPVAPLTLEAPTAFRRGS